MNDRHKPARVRALSTPSGLTIWHVEDYTVPVLSVEFAFIGGAAQDPEGRAGLTQITASLLDEGAGELGSEAFQEALEERAIELSFDGGRDRLDGSLRTLAEHAGRAFELLALALNAPRFDADAIERVRAQAISAIKRDESDPQTRARDALHRLAFTGHPYSRPVEGTLADLPAIGHADIAAQYGRLVARDCLHIVAVGAIGADALTGMVERAFGSLPATAKLAPVAATAMQAAGRRETVDIDIPQSTLIYALPGLARKDADFMTATVVNHILGGGAFTSRLWYEVREKRGLAYSVWSTLSPRHHADLFLAGTATSNERVAESLRIMDEEVARMAEDGPTAEELDKAKAYLAGSYALRFDTSRKIAHQLLEISVDGLGIDYVDRRNDEVHAVTLAEAKRVAGRLFGNARPLVVAAGRPQGLA